jgi:site-specific recombinase XerD
MGSLLQSNDLHSDLDVIAEILGHDNLNISAHYAQVSTRLMMTAYNAAHPHAQTKTGG